MGKSSERALQQNRMAHARDCVVEADRRHTPQQVEQAIARARADAQRIQDAARVRQGTLTLRK